MCACACAQFCMHEKMPRQKQKIFTERGQSAANRRHWGAKKRSLLTTVISRAHKPKAQSLTHPLGKGNGCDGLGCGLALQWGCVAIGEDSCACYFVEVEPSFVLVHARRGQLVRRQLCRIGTGWWLSLSLSMVCSFYLKQPVAGRGMSGWRVQGP